MFVGFKTCRSSHLCIPHTLKHCNDIPRHDRRRRGTVLPVDGARGPSSTSSSPFLRPCGACCCHRPCPSCRWGCTPRSWGRARRSHLLCCDSCWKNRDSCCRLIDCDSSTHRCARKERKKVFFFVEFCAIRRKFQGASADGDIFDAVGLRVQCIATISSRFVIYEAFTGYSSSVLDSIQLQLTFLSAVSSMHFQRGCLHRIDYCPRHSLRAPLLPTWR